jgi:hypothetical protein
MMRERLLAVKGDTFDPGQVRREIEEIASAFGEYLAQAGQRGNSKHRALGAVGKALQNARSVRGEALFGYVRRVHEQITGITFPTRAVEKLDEGLRKLDSLLSDATKAPARAAGEILSRINYATYYDVRRRQAEFFAGWNKVAWDKVGARGAGAAEKPPKFKDARDGKLGDEWKKAAEDYLVSTRIAETLAEEDEEDK